MSVTVTPLEAQSRFAELLARVRDGEAEEVIIAEEGVPVARLTPLPKAPPRRVPGMDAGKVVIAPDFDAPLPDELLDAFEGR